MYKIVQMYVHDIALKNISGNWLDPETQKSRRDIFTDAPSDFQFSDV